MNCQSMVGDYAIFEQNWACLLMMFFDVKILVSYDSKTNTVYTHAHISQVTLPLQFSLVNHDIGIDIKSTDIKILILKFSSNTELLNFFWILKV